MTNESGLIRRKLAHWVERSADASAEELKEAQQYLRKILDIQSDLKGYQLIPSDIQLMVYGQHDDVFPANKVAVLASVRVYLTERQDLERLREEAAKRIIDLAQSLASDSFTYEWIEIDDEGNGRHEFHHEAKERCKAELAQAEADYQEISERLRAIKELESR